MRKPAIINHSTEIIAILSVSPEEEDHGALEEIFRQHFVSARRCKVCSSPTLEWAAIALRINRIPIAICERDLPHSNWRELLERTELMPHLPMVIVTSRLADERLWAEALNLGAWDVLAKPFAASEVIRVVDSAWRHWKDRQETGAKVLEAQEVGISA